MSKRRILVVAEEHHVRMPYREELGKEGYDVRVSDGSEDVLQLLAVLKPDLLVMDIEQGRKRSGLDSLESIRVNHGELPIILCGPSRNQRKPMTMAADDHAVKSWDLGELKEKIKKQLQRKEQALPDDLTFILEDINTALHRGSPIVSRGNPRFSEGSVDGRSPAPDSGFRRNDLLS